MQSHGAVRSKYFCPLWLFSCSRHIPLLTQYGQKADWYHEQAVREFRRSNGDRILSELQEENRRRRLTKEQAIEVLKMGLLSKESDARFAAVHNLAELGEMAELLQAAKDANITVRRKVAEVFADNMYIPGLAALLKA